MTPDLDQSDSLNRSQHNEFNFEWNVSLKVLLVTLSLLLCVCTSMAAIGIIWFEKYGSDSKRIFTNKVKVYLVFLLDLEQLIKRTTFLIDIFKCTINCKLPHYK